MRAAILVVYVVMGVYLVAASVIRIQLQLARGIPLDPLPFIGGSLGVLALLLLIPAFEEWRERRSHESR